MFYKLEEEQVDFVRKKIVTSKAIDSDNVLFTDKGRYTLKPSGLVLDLHDVNYVPVVDVIDSGEKVICFDRAFAVSRIVNLLRRQYQSLHNNNIR